MIYFFLFVFGLAVGSFINVVVYRLNHGKNPLKGRSFCPKCKHQLAWFDNIPLLSFVWLQGKCRYCRKKISWQYPLVELTTGILTVLVVFLSTSEESLRATSEVFLGLGHPESVFSLLVTYALMVIFVSDLLYETIPDEVTYLGMVVSMLYHTGRFFTLQPPRMAFANLGGFLDFGHQGVLSFFLAGLGAAGAFLLLVFITRGKGMGMGDVKLAGLMGLILGYPKIIAALMLAFLTGALVGVILILLGKKHFGEHIPFGPFLAGAAWLSLFWGEGVIAFYLSWLGI